MCINITSQVLVYVILKSYVTFFSNTLFLLNLLLPIVIYV